MSSENPFKGPQSYNEGESFYGRDNEIIELYNQIRNDSLTLLFSKSGTGKSSLLKAGLLPFLRQELDFFPIYIHLNEVAVKETSAENLVDFVIKKSKEEIKKWLNDPKKYNIQVPAEKNTASLFKFIHDLKLVELVDSEDELPTEELIKPLLIFDQFEEIFTKPVDKKQIQDLLYEIRYLVENEVPPYLKEEIDDPDNEHSQKLKVSLKSKQKSYRILFAFREEYLPQFESLKIVVPSIRFTNSRFRLEAFSNTTAEEIIIKTAPKISIINAKSISENIAVASQVLDQKTVDPFLLSLICHIIYPELKKIDNSSSDDSRKFIQGQVENAIEEYINNVYENINEETKVFIEKKLITSDGKKNSVNYNDVVTSGNIKAGIDKLINEPKYRLLSKAEFLDSEHVTILHDRLLPPLLVRRSNREAREEEEMLEVKQLANEKKLLEQKKEEEIQRAEKRRRNRIIYLAVSAVAIIGLGFWVFWTTKLIKLRNAISLDRAALQVKATDPTLALRLSGEALKILEKYKEFKFYKDDANQIYSENTFYKTLLDGNPTHHSFISYALSPDLDFILTGSYLDSTATLWNMKGDSINSFNEKDQKGIILVGISQDTKHIFTSSLDNKVRLWRSDEKGGYKFDTTLSKDNILINIAKFSPDNNIILLGYNDSVRVYNLKNLKESPSVFKNDIISVAFSSGGTQIVTGSKNDTVTIWTLKNEKWEFKNFSGGGQNMKVAVSPVDSNLIVTTSDDGMIRLWNINDSMQRFRKKTLFLKDNFHFSMRRPLREFPAHNNRINSLEFSPDGTHILTGSSDNTAILWNLDGIAVKTFKGHKKRIVNVAFSKDGKKIYTGSEDNTFKIWKGEENMLGEFIQVTDPILCAAFPNGKTVITGSKGGFVRIWNTDGGMKLLKSFSTSTKKITSIAFSANQKILTVSEDSIVNLWSLDGNSFLSNFRDIHGKISSVAFSPDGNKILIACGDSSARLYDLNGRLPIKQFKETGQKAVTTVAFNPANEKEILIGSGDGTARLWRDNEVIKKFPGYDKTSVLSIAFSSDGKQILIGSTDSARLWNINGSFQRAFDTHQSPVKAVAFNAKNSLLTGSVDGVVRLWKSDGTLLKEFKGHIGAIITVAFLSVDTKVLSYSEDQSVKLWNIKTASREDILKGDNIDNLENEIEARKEALKGKK